MRKNKSNHCIAIQLLDKMSPPFTYCTLPLRNADTLAPKHCLCSRPVQRVTMNNKLHFFDGCSKSSRMQGFMLLQQQISILNRKVIREPEPNT